MTFCHHLSITIIKRKLHKKNQRLFFQNMTIKGRYSHYLYRVFFYLCKHQIAFLVMNKKLRNNIFFKISILLIFIINSLGLKAQNNCEIKLPEDVSLPICYGEEISLSVNPISNCTYQWTRNGAVISGETNHSLNIIVTENNIKYGVRVTNIETQEECSDEITITMTEQFEIEFEQTQLTCSNNNAENGQNAKVIATAYGDNYESFTYEWGSKYNDDVWTNPSNPQEAIGLKAWREYYVKVTGVTTNGDVCEQTATFVPRAYPNPQIEIVSDPKDTAYVQNPYVTFGFEGETELVEYNSWSWAFYNNPDNQNEITITSILENPVNVYPESLKESKYSVKLNVKSAEYGCDTTFSTEITVLPVYLKIPNVFTPNGDGINDYFIIDNNPAGADNNTENTRGFEYDSYNPINDYYLRTKLTVFNRWGRIVYKSDDYKNDWDGDNLPDGNYFYVIECIGEYEESRRYQGSVTIFGSGR